MTLLSTPTTQQTPSTQQYDSTPKVGEDTARRANLLRTRFLVALPLGTIVMVLSMVPAFQFPGWQWVVGALTLPVVTWAAWPFHAAAFAALKHGATTMDTLVSLGVIASSLWSYWALIFTGAGHIGMKMTMTLIPRLSEGSHPELYFEGATMIVVFLLGGRWAEARTRYRAGDALRQLLDLNAKEATLLETGPDGEQTEKVVPAETLQVGDLFLVRPGEKIATDGVIEQGASAIDTSLLTGESMPEEVSVGSQVTGGTINTWGVLQVSALRVGRETTLAQITQLVTQAQSTKAPVQRLADRVSAVFVPVVIAISLVTLAAWLALGHPVVAAFTAAVAVLVVACPCALGLATPTALLVGSGRASQLGILIRNAQTLEMTNKVTTAVLDKTGTITTGNLDVVAVLPAEQSVDAPNLLGPAAGAEAGSEHPLARAIRGHADKTETQIPAMEAFSNHAGKGVSAWWPTASSDLLEQNEDGGVVLVGGMRWLTEHGVTFPTDLLEASTSYEKKGATVVAVALSPHHNFPTNATAPSPIAQLEESALPDTGMTITMDISGMTCAACVGRVERKLKKLPGVNPAVNLATETATITLDRQEDGSEYTDSELEEIVKAAGYDGHVTHRQTRSPQPAAPETVATNQARQLPNTLTDTKVLGIIVLEDTVKPDAKQAITELKKLGITPMLLSGDNWAAAHHVANQVGIEHVYAQVLPQGKQEKIKELQDTGESVVMVGDGVNDAAAMAQASTQGLAIAMGSGTDVAMEVADITLVNSDLPSVPLAIRISRKTLGTIKGNLFWAFFYNVLMVPLAVLGLLNPMFAALAMAFSSVFVVLNSLRLRTVH